ncbi:MAG: hypothetical protein IJF54_02335 [Clostridia bacterium]|nr:hypothetical protein [Clostridia bacterium]
MNQDLKSLMEQYAKEAKAYQQKSKSAEPTVPPAPMVINPPSEPEPEPEPIQQPSSIPNEQPPSQLPTNEDTSHIIHDKNINQNIVNINTQYVPPENQDQTVIPGATGGLDGVGFLKMQVFTAKGAFPLSGAFVTVTTNGETENRLIYRLITDQSGETSIVPLPTVPFSMSQQPEPTTPYATYNIRIDLPGYFTVNNLNVPVFDRETTIQPVEMIPVPENYIGNTVTDFQQTGPNL